MEIIENNKGQLRIQETAFMIVGIFLFFTLVGLFVLTIVYSNIQDSATKIAEDRTLSAVTSLSNSPELSCVASKVNCIDEDKLINLINSIIYREFWTFSSLKVIKLSGFDKSENKLIECNLGNYPDCDLFVVYDKNVDNERAVSSFVALCRKELENGNTYDKCEVAKIVAGTELK